LTFKVRVVSDPPHPVEYAYLNVVPDDWSDLKLDDGKAADVGFGISAATLPAGNNFQYVWDVQSSTEQVVKVGNVKGVPGNKDKGSATLTAVGFGVAEIKLSAKLVPGTETGSEGSYDVTIYATTIKVKVNAVIEVLEVADVPSVGTDGKTLKSSAADSKQTAAAAKAAAEKVAAAKKVAAEKAAAAKKAATPKKVKSVAAKSLKAKTATITWKAVTTNSGYQIKFATDKAFSKNKKTVNVKGGKVASKKATSLKKGKTYYVKVRAYKTVNGKKIYGAYSTTKKVKVK
jgi:hypothetical protein